MFPSTRAVLMRELGSYGLPRGPSNPDDTAVVTDKDIEPLPEPARRYLRFMNVLGRARDWSFRLGFVGRFRPSKKANWVGCEAWQYSTRLSLARIFYISLRLGGVVPFLGRDVYAQGKGRMLVRALDLVTVEDGQGEEFDIGELVTYLNDGVFIAPSMLLSPEVSWYEADPSSFDLALTDHGRTVWGRVFIDENGAPVNFETTDRFFAGSKVKGRPVRAKWSTPVGGWQQYAGRRLWTRGQAVWNLEDGEFIYGDMAPRLETLAFNVAP